MGPMLETPRSPSDDEERPAPIFVPAGSDRIETPASPRDSGRSTPFGHTTLLQCNISPPPTKRPRLDESVSEYSGLRFSLSRQEPAPNPTTALAKLLGSSSSSPVRGLYSQAERVITTNGKRHYTASSSLSRQLQSKPPLPFQPPTGPRNPSLRGDSYRPPPLERSISDGPRLELPRPTSPTINSERAASVSRTSTSEVSSVSKDPENCITCRFALGQNVTAQCGSCNRRAHKACASNWRAVYEKRICERCSRKAAREANAKTKEGKSKERLGVSEPVSRSITPKERTERSSATVLDAMRALEEAQIRSRDPLGHANTVSEPVSPRPPHASVAGHRDIHPEHALRDTGVRPAGNAFAKGSAHLFSDNAPAGLRREDVVQSPVATESEASMDLSDDPEFMEADLITSTPMPKYKAAAVEEAGDEHTPVALRVEALAAEDVRPTIEAAINLDSGESAGNGNVHAAAQATELPAQVVEFTEPKDRVDGPQQSMDKPAAMPTEPVPQTTERRPGDPRPLDTASVPDEVEAQPPKRTPIDLLPIDTSATISDFKPAQVTTPTTATTLASTEGTPRRNLPPGFKIKKRDSLQAQPEKTERSPQSTKPTSMGAWARAFVQAGCEDPFREGKGRNEALNCCEDIYATFGKCPWQLVRPDLRPKRFKVELLKALASLKNVLDRFEGVEKCLGALEGFIVERRAKDSGADLGAAKLTTGDVLGFVNVAVAMPVFGAEDAGPMNIDDDSASRPRPAATSPPGVQDAPHPPGTDTVQDIPGQREAAMPTTIPVVAPARERPKAARETAPGRAHVPSPTAAARSETDEREEPSDHSRSKGRDATNDIPRPSGKTTGFNEMMRPMLQNHIFALLGPTAGEKTATEITDIVVDIAAMEHASDASLQAKESWVRALVQDFKYLGPQRYQVMLHNSAISEPEIEKRNKELLKLYTRWIDMAVEEILPDLENKTAGPTATLKPAMSQSNRPSARIAQFEALPFKHLFWQAVKAQVHSMASQDFTRDQKLEIATDVMTLLEKENTPLDGLKVEDSRAYALVKALHPLAEGRANIMASYRRHRDVGIAEADLRGLYSSCIADAMRWSIRKRESNRNAEESTTVRAELPLSGPAPDVDAVAAAASTLQSNLADLIDVGHNTSPRPSPELEDDRTDSIGVRSSRPSVQALQTLQLPPEVHSNLERRFRKHYGHLLSGAADDTPIHPAEVVEGIMKLATMEQSYTDEQLANEPEAVRMLVKEIKSMTAKKKVIAAKMQIPLLVKEAEAEMKQINDASLMKGVNWAIEHIRERRREIANLGAEQVMADDLEDTAMEEAGEQSASISHGKQPHVDDAVDEDNDTTELPVPATEPVLNNDTDIHEEPLGGEHEDSPLSEVPDTGEDNEGTGTPSDQLFSELRASMSRAQSVQANSDLTSELTELEQTPEPPAHIMPPAKTQTGPRKLKLRVSAIENAAKSSKEKEPGMMNKSQTTIGGKPSRGFTPFTFRELILLAVYEEPRRLYGRKAQLPKLTSKEVADFVVEKFPQYSDAANQTQRTALFGNIAAQCSTHVNRGTLKKDLRIEDDGKSFTVYYADTASSKFLTEQQAEDLSTAYSKHLHDTFGDPLHTGEAAPAKKRPLEVPETPMPKRLKMKDLIASASASTEAASEPSEAGDHLEVPASKSIHKAARKGGPMAPPATVEKPTEKTPRLMLSASRMRVETSSSQAESSPGRQKRAPNTSSDRTIPESVYEAEAPAGPAPAVQAPERDEPRAYVPDPLDGLLSMSVKPTDEEQELLDMLSVACEKEAARESSKLAQKKFEVKDFFAQWPEHHPNITLLFDTERRIEETKRRSNRRQMLGRPCQPGKSTLVYRPYAGLEARPISGAELNSTMSFGSNPTSRTASPSKRQATFISPRKRRAMHKDDSNIYADEIDITAIEQAEAMGTEEKKASSWQEAIGLPKKLELGWMQDISIRKNERLVYEVPESVRGRSRNWFKAILPDD